jgi:hypothetical protein
MKCFYGIGVLEPSIIEEFDRCEGPRIITHINHPLGPSPYNPIPEESRIWLKTFGLHSFMIACLTSEVESVIKSLNLVRKSNASTI